MSNITLNNFFSKAPYQPTAMLSCSFLLTPLLLSRPHAPPPQCSVLYACALCSCILNKSEINVFDAESQTSLASLYLPLFDLGHWYRVGIMGRTKTGAEILVFNKCLELPVWPRTGLRFCGYNKQGNLLAIQELTG